jgi:hypothetical protein
MKNKSKDDRYLEAVKRNLYYAETKKGRSKKDYKGLSLSEAKTSLGIKKTDPIYDERVKKLIEVKKDEKENKIL